MKENVATTTGMVLAGGLALFASACSGAGEGEGNVEVSLSGQDFVMTGWPAMDGDELVAFDDDWTVKFEHVVVSIASLRLAAGGDELWSGEPESYLVDVRRGDAELWSVPGVPAQRWDDVGYRFVKPDAETQVLGEVPTAIREAMQNDDLSMWIEGTGEKEGEITRFQFAIPAEVTMTRCLNGRDETDGIIVGDGRTTEVELTLHMDHLFWDDHEAEEPRLLFGPIAYAADADGVVTLDDLATQRLTDMKSVGGSALVDGDGAPIVYVPRVELPDNNLREYMIDTAMTLGHFNGEGHCEYAVAY